MYTYYIPCRNPEREREREMIVVFSSMCTAVNAQKNWKTYAYIQPTLYTRIIYKCECTLFTTRSRMSLVSTHMIRSIRVFREPRRPIQGGVDSEQRVRALFKYKLCTYHNATSTYPHFSTFYRQVGRTRRRSSIRTFQL